MPKGTQFQRRLRYQNKKITVNTPFSSGERHILAHYKSGGPIAWPPGIRHLASRHTSPPRHRFQSRHRSPSRHTSPSRHKHHRPGTHRCSGQTSLAHKTQIDPLPAHGNQDYRYSIWIPSSTSPYSMSPCSSFPSSISLPSRFPSSKNPSCQRQWRRHPLSITNNPLLPPCHREGWSDYQPNFHLQRWGAMR